MDLLKFPNEVILAIAEALDFKGTSRLLCCCKRLHNLLDPYLYKLIANDPMSGIFRWACCADPYKDASGRLDTVRRCIKAGIDVNMLWPYDSDDGGKWLGEYCDVVRFNTPMCLAAGSGHSDLARLLISAGADINLAATRGFPPLIIAILARWPDVVKLLLQNKVSLDVGCIEMGRPLELAARFADGRGVAVFEMLLPATKGFKPEENGDYMAAIDAMTSCNGCALLSLLKSGRIDPNKRWLISRDGTLLSFACMIGHIGFARMLYEHPITGRGARVPNHGVPFQEAIDGCHFDVALYILKLGRVEMSQRDWSHYFGCVCTNNAWDLAEAMIETGVMTKARARSWLYEAESAEYDELTKKVKAKLDERLTSI